MQAATHATRAHKFAKRFGNARPTLDAVSVLLLPNATGSAGAVQDVAKAAALAGAAAQEVVKTAGSGSLQDLVAARVAAAAAASAVSQALAIAMSLQAVAGPPDKSVRIQSRGDINATAETHQSNATTETRRAAISVAQATAAAASCGSAALAVLASAALVSQEVLPSTKTRAQNANISATPAGLEMGAMLNVAQIAAAKADATSTAALGVVTVATNPNANLSLSPSPSFTPFDDALYATVMAAEEVQYAWGQVTQGWSVSIGMDDYPYGSGSNRPSPEPVAIISAPTSSCPAKLVAVREASELPAFRDGSTEGVASYFDNSTGVVTPQGVVWLNTFTSKGNASILPGVLPSVPPTTPVDTSIIQGLTGCPLGTDLDRLMRIAAAYTSVAACNSSSNSSSSDLPWRPWVADHSLVSVASLAPHPPTTSLASAQASHATAQAVITLESSGSLFARSYNPQIGAYVASQGRWRMCGSSLQVKVDRALAPLTLGNTSSKALAFVGSHHWPLTTSLPLERIPEANKQTAPAVLLLAGEPYFVVPSLLLAEDNLSSGTGCVPRIGQADILELGAPPACQKP
ncbi:hypothetical protein V8C86DRAFT_2470311 [Haematococcus lacustris]